MSEFPKRRVLLRAKSFIQPEVHNPFTHRLQLTIWDKLKVAVLSFTLFPIRLLCLSLLLLLASFLSTLTTACMKNEEVPQPLSGIRRILRKPLRGVGRAMLFCMGFHWVKVKGKLSKSEEAPILAIAPHSSFIDALALAVICLPSGVSREENDSIPLLGACIRATQPVYVRRGDKNSRKQTIYEIKRRANSGGKWPHIVIFPEGTCTNRKCLITFKPGAFYTGCPVQPVAIRYPNRLDTVTWTWSGPSAFTLFWLTLCQVNNNMEIEVLFQVIFQLLESVSEESEFEESENEKSESEEDEETQVPASVLERLGSVNALWLRKCIVFTGKNFHVSLKDNSGFLDFREYLIGLALVSQPANTDKVMQVAFQAFDMNGDGRVEESELRHILQSAHPSITDLDVNCLFNQVDSKRKGSVTFEEFHEFAVSHPEYGALFAHQEIESKSASSESDQGHEIKV
ncbi:PREDICTED: lysophosphatidylcholine acyltransferase 2B-like [Acropora digitifera]|uniref:lysophosphatidylcholine acyltransferase 2B-like n=1 Tax=Acropora digitifera TaxID=70779 RepID=UPI00077AEB61|nr:PREDICTED: lysophosphatidylcholine acyltransferase 2B-like [Acropora digitifera]